MAPLAETANQVHAIVKRDRCWVDYYGYQHCYSAWYYYGRWILLAICITCIFLSIFLMARRNSRRRRMQGAQPMYGTGWMAPAPPPYNAPPPQYSAQPPPGSQGGYFAPNGQKPDQQNGASPGYWAGQQEGVQLQQPQSAYHRGPDEQFSPPEGPPPNQAHRFQ